MGAKHEFGWYLRDESCRGEGDDPWQLIEEAVNGEAEFSRLHGIDPNWNEVYIGPFVIAKPSDYLNQEDITDALSSRGLCGLTLVGTIDVGHEATVNNGAARADSSARAALLAVNTKLPASEILEAVCDWADNHVHLDPARYVDGSNALPVERARGKWVYGGSTLVCPEASVMPELDVDGGSVVWVAQVTGFPADSKIKAPNLKDAMAAVDRILAARPEGGTL